MPEWDVFTQGIAVVTILLSVVGAAALGIGMCMVMAWNNLVLEVVLGIVGILLLLCLIPMIKGLK